MPNRERHNQKQPKSKKHIGKVLLVCAAALLALLPWRRRIEREVKEFTEKEAEKFSRILAEEAAHFPPEFNSMLSKIKHGLKDFFIPHAGNDHQPKGLRSPALKFYAVLLVLLKVFVVAFLFFTYPNPAILSQKIASEIFALTNTSRVDAGVPALELNNQLNSAAQAKADDMVTSNYFAHISPDGKQPWQWIDKGEYRFLYMGENLAMDFSSAKIAHSAFQQSPSHWKNIMNPKYRDMGIGVAVGQIDGRETVVLVEFFGSTQAETASPALADAQAAATQVAAAATPPAETKPAPAVTEPVATPVVTQPPVQTVTPPAVEPEPEVVVAPPVENISQSELNESEVASPAVSEDTVTQPTETVPEAVPTELEPEITAPVEFSAGNDLVMVQSTDDLIDKGLVDYVIEYSRYAFLLFLVALVAMLLVNVMVKPHIQHSAVILQTLGLIILVSTIILTRFHLVETLPQVLIF